MFTISYKSLPGSPGTLYYSILLQIEGELYLFLKGTPVTGFAVETFATIEAAAHIFSPVTDPITRDKRPGPRPVEAMSYLISIWPLIIGIPKDGPDLAEYAVSAELFGSPILQSTDPVGLLKMRTPVKRFVVRDLVQYVMPGIQKIDGEGGAHYRWSEMILKGPAGN